MPTLEHARQAAKSFYKRLSALACQSKSDILLGLIFSLTAILYALLMVRDHAPTLGLIVLIGLWFLHGALTGWWRTPMDVPILGLLLMLPLSFTISIDQCLTIPKVHGLILGISLFYVVVNAVHTPKRLSLAVFALVLLAIGVAILGLIGTDWYEDKLFELPALYNALPRLVKHVPRSISGGGIHFNLMAGALVFFLPLLANILWNLGFFDFSNHNQNGRLAHFVFVLLLILGLILVTFILFLTQSRGAYLGAITGLLALAVIKDRRYLWAIPLLLLAFAVLLQRFAHGDLATLITLLDTQRGGTLPGRMEIWRRALLLIQDFPLTGLGLGTFHPLVNRLYPFFTAVNPQIPHPHNQVLTMAVDLGLPGLAAYLALLTSFARMVWCAWPKVTPQVRALLAGLAGGLLAHQIFGFMDAFMLGTKLGAILWIYFGLVTAVFLHSDPSSSHAWFESSLKDRSGLWHCPKNHLTDLGVGLAKWLILSLFAIAFVNLNVILSLIISTLGGVLLGMNLTAQYD